MAWGGRKRTVDVAEFDTWQPPRHGSTRQQLWHESDGGKTWSEHPWVRAGSLKSGGREERARPHAEIISCRGSPWRHGTDDSASAWNGRSWPANRSGGRFADKADCIEPWKKARSANAGWREGTDDTTAHAVWNTKSSRGSWQSWSSSKPSVEEPAWKCVDTAVNEGEKRFPGEWSREEKTNQRQQTSTLCHEAGTGNSQWVFLEPAPPATDQSRAATSRKREEYEITVSGEGADSSIPPITTFQELAGVVPEYVLGALCEAGIERPMPIQAQTLPLVLRGFDLIGIAKTGSGKTLAFLLPAIVHIESQPPIEEGDITPIALVLAPVRELAVQIADEANKLLTQSNVGKHPRGIGAVCIYGGGARCRWQQVSELQKGWCHIVTATPGRVCDLMSSNELSLDRVTYFVLDEADRMLDSGFGEQMDTIAGAVRSDRQTMFFSATWPPDVQELAGRMCHVTPIRVSVGQLEEGSGPASRADIIQELVVFDGGTWQEHECQKQERLYAHLRALLKVDAYKVLVFVNMKSLAWELAGKLCEEGFKADFMYGGRSQDSRHEVVKQFKAGSTKLLVTTDVMARGLDIPDISHVVVYDCYGGIDEYVHRIGRTARGPYGKGHALTFFEYDPKYSEMPGQLMKVLEQAGQEVPQALRAIVDEVASGQRPAKLKGKWK